MGTAAPENAIDNKNLTLDEIDEGRLLLHANRELARIVKDIADPNKIATKEREVTIKLKFKPNKQRSAAEVSYSVTHKPAGHVMTTSDIYLGVDKVTKEAVARPFVPNQTRLFSETDKTADDELAS